MTDPSTVDPFYSPKRRLARAKKHASELETASIGFLKGNPYVSVVELDDNGVTKLHKLKLTKPIPEDLSDIATDALDNLRSVLDQTIHAVFLANGKTPPKFTNFPFSDTAKNWEDRTKGSLSQDFPSEIVAVFRGFKPYEAGNVPLWGLNELRNANQHALLAPLGHSSIRVTSTGPFMMKAPANGSISFNPPIWNPITWDSTKNEMVIFREDPGGQLDYNLEFSLFIAFGCVPVFSGEPVIGVFDHLARQVEGLLMATEAECRRIGIIR
jgi:hypothetical protein